jgi:hypothetical protein
MQSQHLAKLLNSINSLTTFYGVQRQSKRIKLGFLLSRKERSPSDEEAYISPFFPSRDFACYREQRRLGARP